MAMIKVTSEDLGSTAAQLTSGSQSIEEQLSTMHSRVQELVDANWQGAASTSFQDLWAEWTTSATNLQTSLEGIAGLLNSAAAAYDSTEAQIQQSMH